MNAIEKLKIGTRHIHREQWGLSWTSQEHRVGMLKIVIAILFIVVLASLGFALATLVKDRGKSKRTVNALTVRIVFSVLIFLILFLGFISGALIPHGIVPG